MHGLRSAVHTCICASLLSSCNSSRAPRVRGHAMQVVQSPRNDPCARRAHGPPTLRPQGTNAHSVTALGTEADDGKAAHMEAQIVETCWFRTGRAPQPCGRSACALGSITPRCNPRCAVTVAAGASRRQVSSIRYSHDGRYWPIAVDQHRVVEADYSNASADIRSQCRQDTYPILQVTCSLTI